jgi:hypothetical protein
VGKLGCTCIWGADPFHILIPTRIRTNSLW